MDYLDLNSESIRGFLESPEWLVFQGEVKDRLESIRTELETGVVLVNSRVQDETGKVSKEAKVIDYGGIRERQGECKSLRWILNMPTLLQELQAGREQQTKKEVDNDSR